MEQRGKFSALAREDNISGVHTAKNLLSKRLPLTVRSVKVYITFINIKRNCGQ